MLFNILLADLFFIADDFEIASYIEDNTPYISGKDIEEIKQSLEEASRDLALKWFLDSLMKSNVDKCHLLVSTSNKVNIRIDNIFDVCSKCAKLLAVKSDHKLTFDDHISEL